ncbi:hypothetical protein SRABI83_02749 [Arthrobacter sp. Bi83]|nr:hypothetical protein SRABI83_02749 [Arthrobacter sp. Bi83]
MQGRYSSGVPARSVGPGSVFRLVAGVLLVLLELLF